MLSDHKLGEVHYNRELLDSGEQVITATIRAAANQQIDYLKMHTTSWLIETVNCSDERLLIGGI